MKNMFRIYFLDWKDILTIPSAALLFFGLIVLPSVYAWVNIKAMWDPYENTSGIKIAITNEDTGALLQDEHINIGRQVVRNLKNNHKLGWTFVDKDTAHDGVVKGKYYASLFIPRDFSQKISSIESENPEKPEIVYTVNEKINAVSPKITQSGVSTVINQVSDNFTKSVGNAIFKKFNEAGMTLEKEMPTILSFEQKIFSLEKEFSQINQMGDRIISLDQKMNELKKRAGMIQEFQKSVPDIDKLGAVILKTEESLPKIKVVFDQLAPLQDNLLKLQTADDTAGNLERSLTDLETAADKAISKGNAAQKTNPDISYQPDELEAIKEELHQLKNTVQQNKEILSGRADSYTEPLQKLSLFAQQDWPAQEQKIQQAANFMRNDWPGVKQDIQKAGILMDTQLPQIEQAIYRAAIFAEKDLPAMEKSITRTADKIRDFERNNNLRDIIKALKNDAQKESDFLASPITLKENKIFPIPNYGSAMTPFYTLLALWVGGMLLISSLKVGEVPSKGEVSPLSFYFGRLMTFATIGMLQGLVVSLGDLFIIHSYIVDKTWFVLFAMFLSIVFVILTYTLVSIFGNVGKGLSVIFLVLQFSSSGGTFPVTMTSSFFQKLNPYMPFTYGVSLLREATGGMIREVVLSDLYHLLLFPAVFLIAALFLRKPLQRIQNRRGAGAKKARILQ
ncbi:putative membrane protein [Bacillus sp. OV194]|nr:putative membrane protein [Bacillus sp. OV194]